MPFAPCEPAICIRGPNAGALSCRRLRRVGHGPARRVSRGARWRMRSTEGVAGGPADAIGSRGCASRERFGFRLAFAPALRWGHSGGSPDPATRTNCVSQGPIGVMERRASAIGSSGRGRRFDTDGRRFWRDGGRALSCCPAPSRPGAADARDTCPQMPDRPATASWTPSQTATFPGIPTCPGRTSPSSAGALS